MRFSLFRSQNEPKSPEGEAILENIISLWRYSQTVTLPMTAVCGKCKQPLGKHSNENLCPDGNWYSETQTFQKVINWAVQGGEA